MNIPIRSGSPALDVMERRWGSHPPVGHTVNRQPPGGLSAGALEPVSGRDVSRELDVLFTRLAARAPEQRPEVIPSRGTIGDGPAASSARLTLGSSTSQATLSGSFGGAGAATATALRVDISQAASVGSNPGSLKFTVSNQDGAVMFSYDGLAKAGQPISLGSDIGLQIAFSAGSLQAQSSGQVPVTALQPHQVDVNATFNEVDPDRRPRFEGGSQVKASSFLVDGRRIEARADDSITSVLQRISENVPGIEASFANSGLLGAMGLDGGSRRIHADRANAARAAKAAKVAYARDDGRSSAPDRRDPTGEI